MMVEDFNIITTPDSAVKYVTFKEGRTYQNETRWAQDRSQVCTIQNVCDWGREMPSAFRRNAS